jgi:hypothetical protein
MRCDGRDHAFDRHPTRSLYKERCDRQGQFRVRRSQSIAARSRSHKTSCHLPILLHGHRIQLLLGDEEAPPRSPAGLPCRARRDPNLGAFRGNVNGAHDDPRRRPAARAATGAGRGRSC